MVWYAYVGWFFASAFLVNAIPHVVQGVSGNRFQTPFASPRGIGESSAVLNVIWGFINLAIGGVLPHAFLPERWPPHWPLSATALAAAPAMTLYLANYFGNVRTAAP